jgi:hypothetical protein
VPETKRNERVVIEGREAWMKHVADEHKQVGQRAYYLGEHERSILGKRKREG